MDLAEKIKKAIEESRIKNEEKEPKEDTNESKEVDKEKIEETFVPKSSRPALDVIKELITYSGWSNGKKTRKEALKRFEEMANSDEYLSNRFFKKLENSVKFISEGMMKKFELKNKKGKKETQEMIEEIEDNSEINPKEDGILGLSKFIKKE